MIKRRKLPPDTRLDWRDPDMPVLRIAKSGGMMLVAPEWINNYHATKIASPYYTAPHYKDDPSYWWSRKNNLK